MLTQIDREVIKNNFPQFKDDYPVFVCKNMMPKHISYISLFLKKHTENEVAIHTITNRNYTNLNAQEEDTFSYICVNNIEDYISESYCTKYCIDYISNQKSTFKSYAHNVAWLDRYGNAHDIPIAPILKINTTEENVKDLQKQIQLISTTNGIFTKALFEQNNQLVIYSPLGTSYKNSLSASGIGFMQSEKKQVLRMFTPLYDNNKCWAVDMACRPLVPLVAKEFCARGWRPSVKGVQQKI